MMIAQKNLQHITEWNMINFTNPQNTILQWKKYNSTDIKSSSLSVSRKQKKTSGYAMVVHGLPKTPKNTSFLGVIQSPGVAEPLYSRGHN